MAASSGDLDAYDPPDPAPVPRHRPRVQGTVAPEIAGKLDALHARKGGPFAYVLEDVLRAGLAKLEEEQGRAA